MGLMLAIPTIQQPLSAALFQQADQVREFLDLARQKVEFATAQMHLDMVCQCLTAWLRLYLPLE